MVHNQSAASFNLPPGITIQPGYTTYVGINRIFTNKKEAPYSDCQKDLTPQNDYAQVLYGYFKDFNVTYYDQNLCFTLCFQDKLIDKCACLDITTPQIRNSTYCVNQSDVNCLNDFNAYFKTADINDLCQYACPARCRVTKPVYEMCR